MCRRTRRLTERASLARCRRAPGRGQPLSAGNSWYRNPCLRAPHLSATNKEYAKLTVNIRVTRKSGYWQLNVILSLFIVTSCSFSSYGVAPDELAVRCLITIASLLSVVGFKYVVSAKLPDIKPNLDRLFRPFMLGRRVSGSGPAGLIFARCHRRARVPIPNRRNRLASCPPKQDRLQQ